MAPKISHAITSQDHLSQGFAVSKLVVDLKHSGSEDRAKPALHICGTEAHAAVPPILQTRAGIESPTSRIIADHTSYL